MATNARMREAKGSDSLLAISSSKLAIRFTVFFLASSSVISLKRSGSFPVFIRVRESFSLFKRPSSSFCESDLDFLFSAEMVPNMYQTEYQEKISAPVMHIAE